jgi:hypothetical protein
MRSIIGNLNLIVSVDGFVPNDGDFGHESGRTSKSSDFVNSQQTTT